VRSEKKDLDRRLCVVVGTASIGWLQQSICLNKIAFTTKKILNVNLLLVRGQFVVIRK